MVNELLREIDKYVVGRSSLQELESYLVFHLQDIIDSGDKIAIDLANKVDTALIELDEGLIDENELLERLLAQIRFRSSFSIQSQPPAETISAAESETITSVWRVTRPMEVLRAQVAFG